MSGILNSTGAVSGVIGTTEAPSIGTATDGYVFTATGAPTKDLSTYKNGSFVQNITTGSESYISVDGTHSEITLGQEYDADTSGGFDPAQSWLGKMGIVKFYNRVLTDEEILQNYYSHKTRFGI